MIIKKYKKNILWITIPALIGIIFKFLMNGYDFLGYAFFFIAAASVYFLIIKVEDEKNHKVCSILNKIGIYLILIFLFLICVTITVIAGDTKTNNNENAEYAIVFGTEVIGTEPSRSLETRLELALEYSSENPDTIFILSGGQGSNEEISEALCMYNWLTENGLSPERIILEDQSSNTYENVKYSSEIIFSINPEFDGKVCVITEAYHATRAKLCAEDAGFVKVVSDTGFNGLPILTANQYLREVFALWNYMLFVR